MKKAILISIVILLTYGCKKTETPETPKATTVTSKDYTVEFLNCPQGLNILVNDTTIWNYQLGTNVYTFHSKDSLNIQWHSNFNTTNFRLNIDGINSYYCNFNY